MKLEKTQCPNCAAQIKAPSSEQDCKCEYCDAVFKNPNFTPQQETQTIINNYTTIQQTQQTVPAPKRPGVNGGAVTGFVFLGIGLGIAYFFLSNDFNKNWFLTALIAMAPSLIYVFVKMLLKILWDKKYKQLTIASVIINVIVFVVSFGASIGILTVALNFAF